MLASFRLYFFICFSICCIHQNSFAEPVPAESVLQDSLPQNSEDQEEPGYNLSQAEMEKFHIWPSGVIPYFIDDFSFDKGLRDSIRYYLDSINTVTGLRFIEIPRPPEDDKTRWVFFVNRIGQLDCADVAFNQSTNEGVQKVVLGYDCLASGGLAEVILSLVGVPPQHNSPDRDENIQVNKDNILPDKLYLFDILKDGEWLFHDIPYDLSSAGHYSSHRYTSNGGDTISIRESGNTEREREEFKKLSINLGKWQKGLSTKDVKKIQMLYNYILKYKEGPIEVPGCEQLFSRGSNYGNYESNAINKVKPRKKPKKYLQATGEKDDENREDVPKEEDVSKEGNDDSIKNPDERNDTNDDLNNVVTRDSNVMFLKHELSEKQAKLLAQSDYKTGDDESEPGK